MNSKALKEWPPRSGLTPMKRLPSRQVDNCLFRAQADWNTLQVRTLGWPPAARMSAFVSATFAALRHEMAANGLGSHGITPLRGSPAAAKRS